MPALMAAEGTVAAEGTAAAGGQAAAAFIRVDLRLFARVAPVGLALGMRPVSGREAFQRRRLAPESAEARTVLADTDMEADTA
jgi:hypothetical protein